MNTIPSTITHLNELVELCLRGQKFDGPPKQLVLNVIDDVESILVAVSHHEDAQADLCILIDHATDQMRALHHIVRDSFPDALPAEQERG